MKFDLAINNGTIVAYKQGKLVSEVANVGVKNGKISEISNSTLDAAKVIDAKNLHVLPGIIDSQVHFREPGFTHKEDIETGSKGAALGGVTSFFEMPNTVPATTTEQLLNDKIAKAEARSWVNFAFYIGGSPENVAQLGKLEKLPGCPGVKVFMGSSTGTLLVEDDPTMIRIMGSTQRRVTVHSEDEYRLRERKQIALDSRDVRNHPVWRDVESALNCTSRLINIAKQTKRKVHILHISSAEEIALIRKNKDVATCEILPQHLTLFAPDCYEVLGSKAQQNPPIREKRHYEALWAAVNDGTFDVMGSDHAPHTLEEKAKTYPTSPSGMPMVQTTVPLMLNYVNRNKLTLHRFVELMCENPRKVFGCTTKGRIEVGMDADFTVVDLQKTHEITNKWIASRSGWTPFDGLKVKGWPVKTIVGGNIVMQDDELQGSPSGKKVLFTPV